MRTKSQKTPRRMARPVSILTAIVTGLLAVSAVPAAAAPKGRSQTGETVVVQAPWGHGAQPDCTADDGVGPIDTTPDQTNCGTADDSGALFADARGDGETSYGAEVAAAAAVVRGQYTLSRRATQLEYSITYRVNSTTADASEGTADVLLIGSGASTCCAATVLLADSGGNGVGVGEHTLNYTVTNNDAGFEPSTYSVYVDLRSRVTATTYSSSTYTPYCHWSPFRPTPDYCTTYENRSYRGNGTATAGVVVEQVTVRAIG